MRKTSWAVVAVGLVLGISSSLRAEAQGEARAIIEKAIKASGGEEKLSKYPAATWTENGTFYGMGAGLPYVGKYAVQYPDKFRMEIENVFTIILDGDKGWKFGQDLTEEEMKAAKEERYSGFLTTLLPLLKKEFKLTTLGESQVKDKPAVGIKVSHKGHRDIKLFFDKQTMLLVKTEQIVKDEMQAGKEITQEVFLGNYKDIDGLKVPMKVAINREGKQYVESEIVDYKPLASLDAKTFAKP